MPRMGFWLLSKITADVEISWWHKSQQQKECDLDMVLKCRIPNLVPNKNSSVQISIATRLQAGYNNTLLSVWLSLLENNSQRRSQCYRQVHPN